jgi:hypothetical protein
MAKRFIDTDIWKKQWFRELPPKLKSVWLYLITNCNHAGIFEVDLGLMSFMLGAKITEKDISEHLGEQITILNGGSKWYLHKFVKYQYGSLSSTNKAHKSVMDILNRYDIDLDNLDPSKTLSRPIEGCKDKDKDKDKDKELDKYKDIVEDFYNYQSNAMPNNYKTIPSIDKSAKVLKQLVDIDGYTINEIKAGLNWAVRDDFWKSVILSLAGLRTKSKNGELKFTNMYTKYLSEVGSKTSVEDFING